MEGLPEGTTESPGISNFPFSEERDDWSKEMRRGRGGDERTGDGVGEREEGELEVIPLGVDGVEDGEGGVAFKIAGGDEDGIRPVVWG